jgi:hypothetical protein
VLPLHAAALEEVLARLGEPLEDRIAVVGYGSNAAPSQLRRKLAAHEAGWAVPVLTARLRDADAVYSAHITRYGAIPATLRASAGTAIHVVVTLLSPRQAELVRASEGGNYRLLPLDPSRLALPDGIGAPGTAHVYLSRHGALALDGGPVALRDVPARGRTLPEATEAQMLARAAAVLAPPTDARGLVLECVADPERRRRRVAELARYAIRDPGGAVPGWYARSPSDERRPRSPEPCRPTSS